MKPIHNEKHGFRQVGDKVGKSTIIELIPCHDCTREYPNFHVCGGFRRVLINEIGARAVVCHFYSVCQPDGKRWLALFPGGKPILG